MPSVTWIVKLKVFAAVGVPLITPVEAARESPVGNDPAETLKVYELSPPDAETVWLYALVTIPSVRVVVVMVRVS